MILDFGILAIYIVCSLMFFLFIIMSETEMLWHNQFLRLSTRKGVFCIILITL